MVETSKGHAIYQKKARSAIFNGDYNPYVPEHQSSIVQLLSRENSLSYGIG
jgi:hypothetical protein